jgi:GDP-L-fucose synthase
MSTPTRILLTGGGGMVGRNLLAHPAIGHFEVLAPRSAELDLLDFKATRDWLVANRPDIVIHAAGRVGGIQANLRAPLGFLRDNLDIGRNLVCAARETGVRRLLNLGSSCMYPRGHADALGEEMLLTGELEPSNEGYALAKITTAKLCEYISREDSDYRYRTLIPCNLYGPFDKFDPAHSHLVPAIIHKLHLAKRQGDAAVEIWGDGEARREFMYAGDLADALLRAVANFDSLPDYMNLGIGTDHSVNQYYRAAAEVLGYAGDFVHDLGKPVGMARKLVSIERQLAWGWSARHDLREGIEKTYAYYLKESAQ